MKRILIFCLFLLANQWVMAQTFTLKSKDVGGQATNLQVFNGFGCTGGNTSPQLYWEQAPKDTKSFAVTMYDPDAPSGSGWWHWLIFNVPANVHELKTNSGNPKLNLAPAGSIQSLTDFGTNGYSGPCPPEGHGFHRYVITVYALNTPKLNLEQTANPALVGFTLNSQTIQKASLIVYYKR